MLPLGGQAVILRASTESALSTGRIPPMGWPSSPWPCVDWHRRIRSANANRRGAHGGGGDSLRALALAARDPKDGRRTTHPELVLFTT